jgi:hypothetical protein
MHPDRRSNCVITDKSLETSRPSRPDITARLQFFLHFLQATRCRAIIFHEPLFQYHLTDERALEWSFPANNIPLDSTLDADNLARLNCPFNCPAHRHCFSGKLHQGASARSCHSQERSVIGSIWSADRTKQRDRREDGATFLCAAMHHADGINTKE